MRYIKRKPVERPERTPFSAYLETGLIKALRILSAEIEIPVQTLVNDAIVDLLNKSKLRSFLSREEWELRKEDYSFDTYEEFLEHLEKRLKCDED